MKAIVIHERGGIENLLWEDIPKPVIGPHEVLIRVKACGVNRLDLEIRSGTFPPNLPMPHILGSEVTGEIAELTSCVEGLKLGQSVVVAPWIYCGQCEYCQLGHETVCRKSDILGLMSNGGYAEYVKVPYRNIVPVPPGVSFEEAAAVTLSMLTAWHMLVTRTRIKPGEDVLVLAAGSGIGSAAIQISKLFGARVIAIASTDRKLKQAKQIGADNVINYAKTDFYKEVIDITEGRGVDIVFEHVGSQTWEKSILSLVKNGRLVTCGATSGSHATIDIVDLYSKQISIIGSRGGTCAELKTVLDLTARKLIRPVIHKILPLAAASEAHQILEERTQFGKIILEP